MSLTPLQRVLFLIETRDQDMSDDEHLELLRERDRILWALEEGDHS